MAGTSFSPYASLGMSLLSGYMARSANRTQARLNAISNETEVARAAAANVVRDARNQETAAANSLAYFMQAENNKRRMRAAGSQYEAGLRTLSRMQESQSNAGFEEAIVNAEAAGAYAANASFSGTAGSTVDLIDTTARAQRERQTFYRERNNGRVNYEAAKQVAGIMPAAVEGLDTANLTQGLDYGRDIANQTITIGGGGSVFTDLLSWGASNPTALGAVLSGGASLFKQDQPSGLGLKATTGFETGLRTGTSGLGIRIL
jgi:hypothetical protein